MRIRLTLAFTAVMAVVLVAVGLFVYSRVGSDLDAALDNSLRSRADDIAALAGGGRLSASDQDRLVASDESLAQLIGPGGRVVYSSAGLSSGPVLSKDELARAERGPLFVNRDAVAGFDERLRLLARPTDSGVIVVGATREDREEALSSLGTVLLTGGPIALLLAALAGYGLATAALRPVGAMRGEAAEISRLGSGRRLPVPPAGDELSRLGGTLNEMLERLEKSAERERGFVASASHELRTPLALLKAELELALREGRSAEELREAVASAAGESDRLVQLAEDLLVLARADEGRLPVRPERLDAAELLQSTARRFESRAAEAGRELRVDAERRPGAARGPPARRAGAREPRGQRASVRRRPGGAGGGALGGRRAAARARPRARVRPGARRARVRALHPRRPGALARRHRARAGDRGRDRSLARRPSRWRPTRRRRPRRLGRAAGVSLSSHRRRVELLA